MKDGLKESHSWQLTILVPSMILLLIMALIASSCSLPRGTNPTSHQLEDAFQVTLGIPIEPKVRLLTEKNRYRREDWIGVWVENRTTHVLRFTDQSLGLHAYQYDEEDATWRSVDLGSTLGNPYVTIVTPGPRSPLPSSSIPVDRIRASGKIRLVITGVTDQRQPFAAYKDIEIVD